MNENIIVFFFIERLLKMIIIFKLFLFFTKIAQNESNVSNKL